MSVKTEYDNLLAQQDDIRRALEVPEKKLSDLCSTLEELLALQASLSKRNSPATKTVQEEVARDIQSTQLSIAELEKQCNDIREDMGATAIEAQIQELENNPTRYIEEQTTVMLEKFVKFVHENEDILADPYNRYFEIKRSIGKVEEWNGIREAVPSGNFRLEAYRYSVTETQDFYFKRDLGWMCVGSYSLKFYVSEWFEAYEKQFWFKLKEKLFVEFSYNDRYKIVFTGKGFKVEPI